MKSLIDYLAGKDADSNLTSRIDAKVKEAIAKSLWRKEYMTYKEHMDQEYNRGLEEGRVEGREEGREESRDVLNKLTTALIDSGRIEELTRAAKDPEYQKILIRELIDKDYI